MPFYTYRCSTCGDEDEFFFTIHDPSRDDYDTGTVLHAPPLCTGVWRRTFTPFASPADPIGDGYYDNSSGVFVTSKRQLDDHNRRASELHSARTGVETNFVSHRIEDVAPRLRPDD